MTLTCLNDLSIDSSGRIIKIIDSNIKRRLLDLGLTNGVNIEKVLTNFNKNMSAYYIKNTLIAIRNEDAETVLIEVDSND